MRHFTPLFAIALTLLIHPLPAMAETVFTFQGRLGTAGQPASGPHDLTFRLYDAQVAGAQVGAHARLSAVDVTDGIFTVQLDFGEAPFNSSPRWLEIDVRESGGGAYTTLETRYRVGAAPFAIEALFVAPGAVDTAAIQDGAVTAAKIAPGAVGSAQIANQSIGAIDLAPGSVGTSEIIDGTITPADISGGLYSRKGQLYVETESVLVGFGKASGAVGCSDGNDLLVFASCNPVNSVSELHLVSRRLSNINNDVQPASVQCRMLNDNPTVPERFEATVACIDVP